MRVVVSNHSFGSVLAQDLDRHAVTRGPRSIARLLLHRPALACTLLLRLMQASHSSDRTRLAAAIRWLNILLFGADFVPGCTIGPGLLLLHTSGIVIGEGAVVGAGCTMLHGVTLGEKRVDGGGDHSYPVLGDRVTIGVGATVLGAVRIVDGATVKAGSLLIGE